MPKIKRYLLLTLILSLDACTMFRKVPTDQPTPEFVTPTLASPTPVIPTPLPDVPGISPEQVRNSEYQLGFLDQVRMVKLTDGQYQEGDPGSVDYISVTLTDFIARGDLNGDGEDEAVAIIAENYGGSGTFVFLAVYQYLNEEAVFLTSIFLDDRPIINHLEVDDGEVIVDAIVHNRGDPMCCPTLATTRSYYLNGINLILTSYSTETPTGEPRAITIKAPVNGAQVSGIIRLFGEVSIAPFENNLVYRVYDQGGVELSAGPVNVDASDLGAVGTFEKAVDLGSIITNTTVRIEVQDINVADDSLFAMDSVTLIVK